MNFLAIAPGGRCFTTKDIKTVENSIRGGDLTKFFKIIPNGNKPRLKRVKLQTRMEKRDVEVTEIVFE